MIRLQTRRKLSPEQTQLAASIAQRLGNRAVVMIGLMGCGKSSVGRRLATRLSLPFVDADDEIEKAASQSIEDIFAEHGEVYFREGEKKVISRILKGGPLVLATGGGAFMNPEIRNTIKETGVSIWLQAELPVLMRRVLRRDNRPLLKNDNPEAVMKRLMDERYGVYAKADITVESRDVSHDVIVNDVLNALDDSLGRAPKVSG